MESCLYMYIYSAWRHSLFFGHRSLLSTYLSVFLLYTYAMPFSHAVLVFAPMRSQYFISVCMFACLSVCLFVGVWKEAGSHTGQEMMYR